MKGVTSERACPSIPLLAHRDEKSESRQNHPPEVPGTSSEGRSASWSSSGPDSCGGRRSGTTLHQGRAWARRGHARALSAASWSVLSALLFKNCSAS
ncbi:hypothetical protein E2C01_040461 [Portunus trituberculatus]|uniref:Uncharacterized protein n=1 Tax=Portunus trituberculatus TaxID=210409 RepID=A0A5B7FMQ4_PORTR|nr:hypothetical protein [Portunus trituberculatus]